MVCRVLTAFGRGCVGFSVRESPLGSSACLGFFPIASDRDKMSTLEDGEICVAKKMGVLY